MAKDYWIGFTNKRQKEEFLMMLLSEGYFKELIIGRKEEIFVISKENEENFWKIVSGNFIFPTYMISSKKEEMEREHLFVEIIRIALE